MTSLSLIDWGLVGYSALWILGLSVILAALSLADYHAAQRSIRFREALKGAGYQFSINAGLWLVCLGWLGSAQSVWERLVWAGLSLAFAYPLWLNWRATRIKEPPPDSHA